MLKETFFIGHATLAQPQLNYTLPLFPLESLESIPWNKANLVPDTLSILPTDHKQAKHQKCTHKQQPLINLTTRRRSPFRIHKWTPHGNQIMTLILKLLKLSSSSDEDSDNHRGKSPTNQVTIGLVSDYPTVTVHVEKDLRP